MTKIKRYLGVIFVTLACFFYLNPLSVFAMPMNEFFDKTYEAQLEVDSHSGEGIVNLFIDIPIEGALNTEFYVDYVFENDPLAIDSFVEITIGVGVDFESDIVQSTTLTFLGTLVNDNLYLYDGFDWYAEDISGDLEKLRQEFAILQDEINALKSGEYFETFDLEPFYEFLNEFYILEETETEYILTADLSKDWETFFREQDVQAFVKGIIQEIYKEIILETDDIESLEEIRDEIDEVMLVVDSIDWERWLTDLIHIYSGNSLIYDKETYLMTGIIVSGDFYLQDLVNELEIALDETLVLPEDNIGIAFDVEFYFDNYGEDFDIEKPVDVLDYDEYEDAVDFEEEF